MTKFLTKTIFLTLLVSLSNLNAAETSVVKSVLEKVDLKGNVYYDVELSTATIVPYDVNAGIGYTSDNKLLEAEVFAGIRALRLIANRNQDDSSLHIPYGAKVRVALDSNKTLYAEYQYRDVATFGNNYGLYEAKNVFSIIKVSKDRSSYWGCGVGRSTHNAWKNEEYHAPEKSGHFECRAGKRF